MQDVSVERGQPHPPPQPIAHFCVKHKETDQCSHPGISLQIKQLVERNVH